MTKSLAEVTILIVSAIRMPALLFAWIGMWVTKPIKAQWLRTTVGIILAISLGYLGIFAMEIVLLLSVFSIDEITGENSGFLSNWKKAKANDDARIKAFYQAA